MPGLVDDSGASAAESLGQQGKRVGSDSQRRGVELDEFEVGQ
jgi:hypothetical protein